MTETLVFVHDRNPSFCHEFYPIAKGKTQCFPFTDGTKTPPKSMTETLVFVHDKNPSFCHEIWRVSVLGFGEFLSWVLASFGPGSCRKMLVTRTDPRPESDILEFLSEMLTNRI